jgi:hypothetical protein
MTVYFWSAGSGRAIELRLTASDVEGGYHQGECDATVSWLVRQPHIAPQLAAIDASVLRDELREYGAWDDAALADHDENLKRILWLACGDVQEQPEWYRDTTTT